MSHTVCPVCRSEDLKYLMTCSDHLTGHGSFEITQCPRCRLEFLGEFPDEPGMEKYYNSEDYISHTDSSPSLTGKIYYAVRRFMLSRKRSLVIKTTGQKKGRILDIGSGTGHFTAYMKSRGWESEGVEKNPKAADYSNNVHGIKVFNPEELKALPDHSYDCITMWHVLEHLHNPQEVLSEIRRLLKPGAPAIIALPNNLSFDSFFYRGWWAARDVPRHIWHFNPVSFMYMAAINGFETDKLRRLPFDVFYISILSEKNRGSRIPFIPGMLKGFVFFILSLFDLTRSSSIVYVIRPKAS